jgi:hypothetical protein
MRLFRQQRIGDWGPVFRSMTEELQKKLGTESRGKPLLTEVSAGELLDKISILEIKSRRIQDAGKLANIRKELASLEQTQSEFGFLRWTNAQEVMRELRAINEGLWETEDALRECEREGNFGERFVELARSVYRQNDARADAKRRLNVMLGSALVEEKSYGAEEGVEKRKERVENGEERM